MQKVKPLAIKGDILDGLFYSNCLTSFLGVANMYIYNIKVVDSGQL